MFSKISKKNGCKVKGFYVEKNICFVTNEDYDNDVLLDDDKKSGSESYRKQTLSFPSGQLMYMCGNCPSSKPGQAAGRQAKDFIVVENFFKVYCSRLYNNSE